ncbi:hypothetical protein BSKO_05871 [Bryopsis sp. KO-2023]|nr:hypothetical protein BSKO_05871 [Bryopsis sp. KO-2023]
MEGALSQERGTMTDEVAKKVQDVIDDVELARRSNANLGEMLTALGETVGPKGVVRWPNAVGSRFEAGTSPDFLNSVVVPSGVAPPVEDPGSHYVWTDADGVAGRVEVPEVVFPTMGIKLDDPTLNLDGAAMSVEEPSLEKLAEMNEQAYDKTGVAQILTGVRDPRVRVHGLRDEQEFTCVAMTFSNGDDLGFHFVVTDKNYRRRGLASSLVKRLLADGRRLGMRSATLQASPNGLPVWTRVGFRRVGVIRPYVRQPVVK